MYFTGFIRKMRAEGARFFLLFSSLFQRFYKGNARRRRAKKIGTFQVYCRGFYKKIRAEGAKKNWVQKDGNDKSCFFLANVIFILFFSDRQVIFILLLFSSSFFKQSVIFNLKGGFLTTNGRYHSFI